MTPEEHRLLIEVRDLAEENAKTLRSIQRATRAGLVMKAVYWGIVIAITFGAYYIIQPYIQALTGAISGAQEGANDINAFSITNPLKSLEGIKDLYK